MTSQDVYISRLKRLARKWGGDILDINTYKNGLYKSNKRFGIHPKEFSEAPFSSKQLGVIYKDKLVLCEKETPWHEIIHEMGHVFASRKKPNVSNEGNFFGWEYCVVKYIRAPIHAWYDSNADYGLGEAWRYGLGDEDNLPTFIELGSLLPRQRKIVIAQHIREARRYKLIDNSNRPLAVR